MDLEYPKGFPPDRQTLVELEKIRADRDFASPEQTQPLLFTELEERALRWACRVLGAFSHQACDLGKKGQWTLVQIGSAVEEFRLDLIRKVNFRMTDGRLGWVDRVFGTDIRPEVRHHIENSVEWRRYLDELLEVAEASTRVVGIPEHTVFEHSGPGAQQKTIVNAAADGREMVAEASSSQMSAPENNSLQVLKTGKRRGRRPNQERREAIRTAIRTQGDQWRDHLSEIFTELDRQDVPLGDFQSVKIDLGEGESAPVSTWANLDLADGEQRRQILDALRKYSD